MKFAWQRTIPQFGGGGEGGQANGSYGGFGGLGFGGSLPPNAGMTQGSFPVGVMGSGTPVDHIDVMAGSTPSPMSAMAAAATNAATGKGNGKNKMTEAPNVTPSPVNDPWANQGMFGPIQQAASQFFGPAQTGQIPGSMPLAGPHYMNMQQLYGPGGNMQGIGAAIAGRPQQFQAPAVNPFGQFYLKGVQ